MKHLRKYNESEKSRVTQQEFLLDLQKELEGSFEIWIGDTNADTHITEVDNWEKYTIDPKNVYININKPKGNGTYIDYTLDEFTIPKIRNQSNDSLDDDKSLWANDAWGTEEVKDDYDFLNTTILVVLDRYDDEFIISEEDKDMALWGEVCRTLGVLHDLDIISPDVKKLIRKFNITKK
jgi:hypothetical protein